jgi:3-methyl-2-oxobutanoate hydroxymethyltransferase
MSLTHPQDRVAAPKVTAQTLLNKKRSHQPITALTAYDTPLLVS